MTDTIYIFTAGFGRRRFSSLFQKWTLPPLQIFEHLYITSLFLNKTIKCWYAFSYLEFKEHFGINIILICRNFLFLSVSPGFHMFSTERPRHDAHAMFGDVIYDARNAHWPVNNKIRKFTLFQ